MTFESNSQEPQSGSPPVDCAGRANQFSAYLDGAMPGREMQELSEHLGSCSHCAQEFAAWRSAGEALASLGPARAPENLQSRLRTILATERALGAHLSPVQQLRQFWHECLAPIALRTAGGFAIALVLLTGLGRMFAPALAVQADDDRMTHLVAPRYLYSLVPAQPIAGTRETPLLVDAKVDEHGRVYDFDILLGPRDPAVALGVEADLLSRVFKPASLFGEPVRGHLVMTFTGVSVHP